MFKKIKLKVIKRIETYINNAIEENSNLSLWHGKDEEDRKNRQSLYISGLRHGLHCVHMAEDSINDGNL